MRIPILLAAASLTALHAQTVVEAGLGASRAAATTAPAAGLGKSIAGAIGNLDKAINAGKSSSSVEVVPARNTAPPEKAPPAKPYEDIRRVEVGLEYDQLVERFGPPSLEMAGANGERKLTYSHKDGPTQIEVQDGKVSLVKKPQPATQSKSQSPVFTLPK